MDDWRVTVRVEDALARGSLQEDALEFFRKLLQHVSTKLDLPIAIGSVRVGKEVGRQEAPDALSRVMSSWRQVWDRDEVRKREELVLTVAVDDKSVPQDWFCVAVRSCVVGEKLGDAKQLFVQVYDRAKRPAIAERVATNVDVLVRGLRARSKVSKPRWEFVEVPKCPVASQRVLYAFGRVLVHVAKAAQVETFDVNSESFLPGVSHALRALFAYLCKELGERGFRDVVALVKSTESCGEVLRRFNTVPSLIVRSDVSGHPVVSNGRGVSGGGDRTGGARNSVGNVRALRVATWNIAGGHRSAQAPKTFNALDQRAKIVT